MTRTATLILLITAALAAAACSGDPEVGETAVLCDGGDLVSAELGTLCIYSGPITETRFTCPAALPHRYEVEPGLLICASEEVGGDELFDELRDRGYLSPPDPNNQPGNNRPGNNLPANNVPGNNNPENNTPGNNNPANNDPPPCELGAQQVCNDCEFLTPGVQTCEETDAGPDWTGCDCQESWTVPGVNAVQPPPIDCQEPPELLGLPVDLENTAPLGEPCMEEVFAEACPLLRTRYTRDGELLLRERLELFNKEAYPRLSFYSSRLYQFYGEFEKVWSYGDDALLDLYTEDNELDGTINLRRTMTWDAAGRPLSERSNGEGYETSQDWSYDGAGRVTRQVARYVSEGVDNTYETTRTWGEDGTLLDELTTHNGERHAWIMRTFDEAGQLVRENLRSFDRLGADTTFSYRDDGTLESSRTVESSVAIEENGREFRYTSAIVERSFDERGNELEAITDHSGNGISFTAIRATYDDWDRPLTQSYGPRDSAPETTWTYSYAPEGGPLEQLVRYEKRTGRDRITTTTYDLNEQPLVTEERENISDRLLSRSVNTYTEDGKLQLFEQDGNGDEVIEYRVTWVRDRGGNLFEVQTDVNADGFLEERVVYRYSCE